MRLMTKHAFESEIGHRVHASHIHTLDPQK